MKFDLSAFLLKHKNKFFLFLVLLIIVFISFSAPYRENDMEISEFFGETAVDTLSEDEPIEKTVIVWISFFGSRYHSNQNCSNMADAKSISIEEAERLGYTPCKVCY